MDSCLIRYKSLCTLTLALAMAWLCSVAAAPTGQPFVTTLMHESFRQFDQQLDTGWRTLQVKGDYLGAAAAILEYQSEHTAQLETWQKNSLAFHLAHVYALAGKPQQAVHWFRTSMGDPSFGNDAYIKAFIAFLQHDKTALIAARHTIATTHPGPWQPEDLSEVDAMIDFFGEPFEAAWGALSCHESGATQKTAAWRTYCQTVDIKYRKLYLQHGIKLKTAMH